MTTDKNQNPEQIARDKIDGMLKEAGLNSFKEIMGVINEEE